MDGAIKTQLHFRAYRKTQEELLPLKEPEGIAGNICAISSKMLYICMYIYILYTFLQLIISGGQEVEVMT